MGMYRRSIRITNRHRTKIIKTDFVCGEALDGLAENADVSDIGGRVQIMYIPVMVDCIDLCRRAKQGTDKNIQTDWMRLD
jgi:hypothetical protein